MRQGFHTYDQKFRALDTRKETLFGKQYFVVPCIALVEGVLQASNATVPELALASEFARVPDAWNGRPIVMGHPKDADGNPISANSPSTLEAHQFGFIFNTALIDNAAGKRSLYTEAWLDIVRCESAGGNIQETYERAKKGEVIEVSTGLYSASMKEMGKWDGKTYQAVWREVVPDHLAFLANGTLGACSIADGCGAMRTNQGNLQVVPTVAATTEEDTNATPASTKIKLPKSKKMMRYNEEGYVLQANCDCEHATSKPKANETDRLNRLLANAYPEQWVDRDVRTILDLAVCETFEGYCSLLMFSRDNAIFVWYDMDSWMSATYQVPFTLDDSGKVTFTGPAEEVALLTKIIPVQDTDASALTTNEEVPMTKSPALIAAEKALNEATTPEAKQAAATAYAAALTPTPAPTTTPEVTPTPAAPAAVVVNETPETPKIPTAAEYIAAAPAEVRAVLEQGMRAQEKAKTDAITSIKANTGVYTDAELNAMSVDSLQKLVKVTTPASHARPLVVNGGTPELIDNEGPVPAPLKVFETPRTVN